MNRYDPDWKLEREGEYLWRNPEREHPRAEQEAETAKKRRSIFDIFRRDREDDEQDQRESDRQLRRAAKRHARQVIEPEENERADDDTRKVKKKWRQRLLARSRQQAEELREREKDIPLSATQTAQLMVAERLLQLNHFLETPMLPKEEKKAIKIHIDFMGLLSEKLEHPEYNMPPAIEEIYEQISSATEPEVADNTDTTSQEQLPAPHPEHKTSRNDRTSHQPQSDRGPAAHEPAATMPQPQPPRSDQFGVEPEPPRTLTPEKAVYGAFVAGMIVAVKNALKHEETPAIERRHSPVGASPSTRQPLHQGSQIPLLARETPSDSAPEHTTGGPIRAQNPTSRHYETPQTPTSRLVKPAEFAGATILTMATAVKQADETAFAPVLPTQSARGTAPSLRAAESKPASESNTPSARHHEEARPFHYEQPAPEHEQVATQPIESPSSYDARPVDTWPLEELLREAATISLGYGQYLDHAFRRGDVNREGLVKIIKEKQKGRDYRAEFVRQRESLRRQGAPPERLAQQHPPSADTRLYDTPVSPVYGANAPVHPQNSQSDPRQAKYPANSIRTDIIRRINAGKKDFKLTVLVVVCVLLIVIALVWQ